MLTRHRPLVIIGAVTAILTVLLFAGCVLRSALDRGAVAKVEAWLSGSQADAVAASGRDAAEIVAGRASREAAIGTITMENSVAIHAAPGADAPVDSRLRDAGLAGLCRRAAYSGDQRCVQFAPAR